MVTSHSTHNACANERFFSSAMIPVQGFRATANRNPWMPVFYRAPVDLITRHRLQL